MILDKAEGFKLLGEEDKDQPDSQFNMAGPFPSMRHIKHQCKRGDYYFDCTDMVYRIEGVSDMSWVNLGSLIRFWQVQIANIKAGRFL